jgi:hypothetical protein
MDLWAAYQQQAYFELMDIRTDAHRAFIQARSYIVRRGIKALRRFAGHQKDSRVGVKMAADAAALEARLEAVLAK